MNEDQIKIVQLLWGQTLSEHEFYLEKFSPQFQKNLEALVAAGWVEKKDVLETSYYGIKANSAKLNAILSGVKL